MLIIIFLYLYKRWFFWACFRDMFFHLEKMEFGIRNLAFLEYYISKSILRLIFIIFTERQKWTKSFFYLSARNSFPPVDTKIDEIGILRIKRKTHQCALPKDKSLGTLQTSWKTCKQKKRVDYWSRLDSKDKLGLIEKLNID